MIFKLPFHDMEMSCQCKVGLLFGLCRGAVSTYLVELSGSLGQMKAKSKFTSVSRQWWPSVTANPDYRDSNIRFI